MTNSIPEAIAAVHASAIQTNKGALIFLGPSGTGKSTIHNLLSTHTRATPLANEAVYLVLQKDGRWGASKADEYAHQGPPPESRISELQPVPLKAIFRLFQASEPHLRPLDELQTCRYLTDAFFEIAWQRGHSTDTKKRIFADLATICRSVPGYEFHFDLSQKTAKILCQRNVI